MSRTCARAYRRGPRRWHSGREGDLTIQTAATAASRGAARRTSEQSVNDALRAALPAEYRLYPNVRWIDRADERAPARDGETDLVIVHPEDGLLVVETKGGRIRVDGHGRWYSGPHLLEPPPFEQAERSKHALVRKLTRLPDWPGRPDELRAGHAVAFPDVDVERDLALDAPKQLVIDASDLASPHAAAAAVKSAYDYWLGDRRRGRPLTARELEIVHDLLAPTLELRRSLRGEIAEGEEEVRQLTALQAHVLNTLRNVRRAAVVGAAGSGKTMLAEEKARRLAREGFRTLLVCFNQPLARELAEHLADASAPAGLDVSTFHELCLRLAREAGTLPPEPTEKGAEWFSDVLPAALDRAIGAVGTRYHAIVVDEGQDFARGWLESLELLLVDPASDVFWVFHDPAQSLYREDVVASLGLPEYPLDLNCRNPGPVHAFAARYYSGAVPFHAWREGGREPEVISAEPGRPTLEALRRVLHRLVVEEAVRPWEIAVLTGRSLRESEVWRQRTFGNQVLWNGNYDDAGRSLGLAADRVSEQPSDTTLFDSIRRFKGLERPVVVLVELDADDPRLPQLLYVGATRARQHLIVVGATSVRERQGASGL